VDQSVNQVVIEISRKGEELLIAIVLAGGYGTRLQVLSKNLPKPLLKVAGKPVIGYVFDKLAEVEDIGHVVISTNLRFEQQFREWLESNHNGGAAIIADRSSCEEDKPGAIASLAQIVARINDTCLIIAGDNLFTSDLRPMIRAFKDKSCVTVALYDVGNRELAKQYSTAIMDPEGRIVDLREKPDNPETTLIGTCIYILPQRTLSRLNEYVTEAADRDNPGRFIAWLCKREPVYGHVLDGYWWDIGTMGQYVEANGTLQAERVFSSLQYARACSKPTILDANQRV
jgi:glucose-1-phosphate thymidylyltransferase